MKTVFVFNFSTYYNRPTVKLFAIFSTIYSLNIHLLFLFLANTQFVSDVFLNLPKNQPVSFTLMLYFLDSDSHIFKDVVRAVFFKHVVRLIRSYFFIEHNLRTLFNYHLDNVNTN